MSTTASKQNKRAGVSFELKKAQQHLKNAQEELSNCDQVIKELLKSRESIIVAHGLSGHTDIGGKPRRDALPAPVRKRMTVLADKLSKLIGDIEDLPTTKGEKATSQLKKAKKKGE